MWSSQLQRYRDKIPRNFLKRVFGISLCTSLAADAHLGQARYIFMTLKRPGRETWSRPSLPGNTASGKTPQKRCCRKTAKKGKKENSTEWKVVGQWSVNPTWSAVNLSKPRLIDFFSWFRRYAAPSGEARQGNWPRKQVAGKQGVGFRQKAPGAIRELCTQARAVLWKIETSERTLAAHKEVRPSLPSCN